MNDDQPRWAPSAADFRRGLSEASTPEGVARRRHDDSDAQLEMTGLSWDPRRIPIDRIPSMGSVRGVEKARHRFRAALPDLIWNAAALEGNTFTLPEVRTLLDGVTVGGKRIGEEQQILALIEAYNLLDEMVGTGDFVLAKETSDRLHAIVARHEAIESGHFRGEGSATGGGWVSLSSGGQVAGVPAVELLTRWERLVSYLDDIPDARERALIYNASATRAQYYFDGNKRTARLMMTGELMAHGFDPVNVPHARRLEYNVALDELFSADDATPLLAFLADCALPL